MYLVSLDPASPCPKFVKTRSAWQSSSLRLRWKSSPLSKEECQTLDFVHSNEWQSDEVFLAWTLNVCAKYPTNRQILKPMEEFCIASFRRLSCLPEPNHSFFYPYMCIFTAN